MSINPQLPHEFWILFVSLHSRFKLFRCRSTTHIFNDRPRGTSRIYRRNKKHARNIFHSVDCQFSHCIADTLRKNDMFLFSQILCHFLQVDAHSTSRARRRPSSMHWKSSFLATIPTRSLTKSKPNKIYRRYAIAYSNRANRFTVAANAASTQRVCCVSIVSSSRRIVCINTKLAHHRATGAAIAAIPKHGNRTVIVMNTK